MNQRIIMRNKKNLFNLKILFVFLAMCEYASAADIYRKLNIEFDPVAPASASYEESNQGYAASKWGANVDFNFGGVMSTGPEFWSASYAITGQESDVYRRENMLKGERHRLSAMRLRWHVTKWGQPQSMRGWYVRGAYSYTRIDSKANRFTETDSSGAALTSAEWIDPEEETDLVADIRHGVVAGAGQRWLVANNRMSVTLGTSVTLNTSRTVETQSSDPNAQEDYTQLISELPDSRLSNRVTPELNLAVGYSW